MYTGTVLKNTFGSGNAPSGKEVKGELALN